MYRRMSALVVAVIFSVLATAGVAAADHISIAVHCGNNVITGQDLIHVVDCVVPGGGSYTGDVRAVGGSDFLALFLTNGDFTGTGGSGGVPFATADYSFVGEGVLRGILDGSLMGAPGAQNAGGEFFDLSAEATTFDNNPAPVFWGPIQAGQFLSIPVTGFNEKEGDYSGQGQLQLYVLFNIPDGERVHFFSSAEGYAAVPEPGSLVLLASGLLGLAGTARRRLRR